MAYTVLRVGMHRHVVSHISFYLDHFPLPPPYSSSFPGLINRLRSLVRDFPLRPLHAAIKLIRIAIHASFLPFLRFLRKRERSVSAFSARTFNCYQLVKKTIVLHRRRSFTQIHTSDGTIKRMKSTRKMIFHRVTMLDTKNGIGNVDILYVLFAVRSSYILQRRLIITAS